METQDSMRSVKKGQVTMFVLLGIVILLIVVIFFLLKSYLSNTKSQTEEFNLLTFQEKIKTISNYVETCLNIYSEESLILLGNKGGLINGNFLETPLGKITPSYDEKLKEKITFPDISEIKFQLSKYIESKLKSECRFTKFNTLNINTNEPSIIVSLYDDSTFFELDWNIIISDNAESSELKEFDITINVRLKTLIDASYELLKNPFKSNPSIDKDIDITVYNYEYYSIFALYDLNSKLRNTNYVFLLLFKN